MSERTDNQSLKIDHRLSASAQRSRGLAAVVRLCLVAGIALIVSGWATGVRAQLPPAIGYLHPGGGIPGTTIELAIGGYDWTPDMELFVHEPGVRLELLGPPGPVLIPDPPYWFGKKARRSPFPLPREFPARLSIPPGTPPGIVRWQAANANGATATGRLVISDLPQVLETPGSDDPQDLPSLPLVVAGRIERIEEIDRYRFVAERSGLVTCECLSRGLGAQLNAVIVVSDVSDEPGRVIAEAVDSAGRDLWLSFPVEAGRSYVVAIHDLDYRGDRSFVYRLGLRPGPRVVAAVPARGQRGETVPVDFIGYGLASGGADLESVRREVTFPADETSAAFDYRFETPSGEHASFRLGLSANRELVRPAAQPSTAATATAPEIEPDAAAVKELPLGITGVIDERYGEHRYRITGLGGEHWRLRAEATAIGSSLDLSIAVQDDTGKELAQADDVAGGLDAELLFAVPADGVYEIVVSDSSSGGGRLDAVYRLEVEPIGLGYRLSLPESFAVPIGGKAGLTVQVERFGGFQGAIELEFEGLPDGVAAPADARIPEKQVKGTIEMTADATTAAAAAVVTLRGKAEMVEETEGDVQESSHPNARMLLATTLSPPLEVDAEGQDDVTKWPRGSTFPGPVLIRRNEDFDGPVKLEMTSRQGRHRMGIEGPEVVVPPGVDRYLYPVHLPEWLETTRTSRMVVNGVVEIPDPQGNLRTVVVRQKTRMGFLPTGALLALAADDPIITIEPGQEFSASVIIDRAVALPGLLRLELEPAAGFEAEPRMLEPGQTDVTMRIRADPIAAGEYDLTLRATAWQGADFPVIARTELTVIVETP
ncbi:MAG: hypothetical protein EA381_06255 [Planctomycetaceae bacterium]|nr:MAG: hypothetical protein EA381_06255 [Planctomycetaceae bacterium]